MKLRASHLVNVSNAKTTKSGQSVACLNSDGNRESTEGCLGIQEHLPVSLRGPYSPEMNSALYGDYILRLPLMILS